MISSIKQSCKKSRPGFSLIETVISLSIVSVLFLGLSGAVMVGSHAIPSATETGAADRSVIDGFNRFRADLRLATSIQKRDSATQTVITLTFENLKAAGKPTSIIYTYDETEKNFSISTDARTKIVLIENITYFANTFTEEGSNAIAAFMLISSDTTIQPTFEFNAVLPAKPEYR